jgi:hypothetical protein
LALFVDLSDRENGVTLTSRQEGELIRAAFGGEGEATP